MDFTKIIKIDLRNLSSVDDFERLRIDNNIPNGNYDAETIFKLKSKIDVLFIDPNTYEVFAQIPKKSKDIFLCEGYDSFLRNMKPLKFRKSKKEDTKKKHSELEKSISISLTLEE